MKKIFCLMAMAVMLFSSCLKNEEPASLVELRQAKAALIAADAAYRTAEAALKQAEVEFQNALTAEQVLLNELQALENEAKAIENEIAKLDLEIKKAATEAEKAKWEAEKAKYENDLLEQQQEMEKLIENHKIAMLALLAEVAQAELDYENALKLMEASKLKLTPEQQAIVDGYVAAIKALRYGGSYVDLAGNNKTVVKSISDLRQDLIEANADLQNAQFNWNAETALMQAQLDSAINAVALEVAEKNLEDFIAFTQMENIQEWEEAAAEAEEEAEAIKVEIDNIDVQITAVNNGISDANQMIGNINTEIGKLAQTRYDAYINGFGTQDPEPQTTYMDGTQTKYYPISEKFLLEETKLDTIKAFNKEFEELAKVKVPVSFEVPVEIAQVVAGSINSVVTTDDEVAFNDETKLYEFEDGEYIIERELFTYDKLPELVYNNSFDFEDWAKNDAFTEKSNGLIEILEDIRDEIKNDKQGVADANLEAAKEQLAIEKAELAKMEADFNKAKGYWVSVLEELPAAMSAYKLGYPQDAQDDLLAAHKAYMELVAELNAKVPSEDPSEAQMNAYLAHYAKYLKLREKLTGVTHFVTVDGKDEPLYNHLKAENWGGLTPLFTDATLYDIRDEDELSIGYNKSVNYPASVNYKDEDFAKEGLLPKWHHLSQVLWGLDELRVSVDEYVGEGFRLVNTNTVAKIASVYNAFVEVGYSFAYETDRSFKPYEIGLWMNYESKKFEVAKQENILNNGEKYDALIADIDEIIVALKEQVKAYSAESEGLVAELEKIDEEIKAVIDAADEVTDEAKLELLVAKQLVIDALEELQAQLKELNIERQSLNTEMGRYNSMASTYRGYIAKYYAAEAGVTLPTFAKSEAIQAAFTDQIQAFEQEIIDATEDLNETLEALEQIYNGTDDDNVYFEQQLEKAKAEVEEIEAQIEERLAEIEKYEELLKGTLAAFAGETTPEA